jgi:limonene-1,2-epoxide hydrolase
VSIEVDRSEVVAEVTAAFEEYERALVDEDHDALDRRFWNDARVIRFGIAEIQYGAEAIAEWRRRSPSVGEDRRLTNTVVTAFGADVAVVATEFSHPSDTVVGRQSQTWVRLDDGWRIVHAHVSVIDRDAAERSGHPRP